MRDRLSHLLRNPDSIRPLIVVACVLGLLAGPVVVAAADNDDWPVRLTAREGAAAGQKHWMITAENLADFPCTKLRLEATMEGGSLLKGYGQSTAGLVNGKLVFQEVATIKPGESMHWTIDADPIKGGPTVLKAKLEYAEQQTPRPAPRPAAPAPQKGCNNYAPPAGRNMTVSEIVFPTGSRTTGALLVHQAMPVEVQRNQKFAYEYYVTNISAAPLQNVELQASGFHNLRAGDAQPPGEVRGDMIVWPLGELAECETKVITVNATATDIGLASACLTATYSNRLCAMTKVVEPALKVVKTAPPEALICDEIEMVLTVTNPGSGVARGVRVSENLPEGLTTTDGKRKLEGDVGDLAPGDSKKLAFRVKASAPGTYGGGAVATAASNLTAESNKTSTIFRQPMLEITCSAPEQQYFARTVPVSIVVKNKGDAPVANTTVRAGLTAGAELMSVSKGGTPGRTGITWELGALPPGGSQTLGFEVRSSQPATLGFVASAAGVCAPPVEASDCETRVIGIPAILLEVIDIEDPVEAGKPTTYVVSVTNQGTAPGTNIKVACQLPDQMTYVSSTGPTQGTTAGNKLTFGTIPSLAPKQKVEWRINVNSKTAGDARLGVELHSDQFSAPIMETESTNIYK